MFFRLCLYLAKWQGNEIKSKGCKTKSEAKNHVSKKLWDEVIYPDLVVT